MKPDTSTVPAVMGRSSPSHSALTSRTSASAADVAEKRSTCTFWCAACHAGLPPPSTTAPVRVGSPTDAPLSPQSFNATYGDCRRGPMTSRSCSQCSTVTVTLPLYTRDTGASIPARSLPSDVGAGGFPWGSLWHNTAKGGEVTTSFCHAVCAGVFRCTTLVIWCCGLGSDRQLATQAWSKLRQLPLEAHPKERPLPVSFDGLPRAIPLLRRQPRQQRPPR
jgi:hypothetical protein